MPELLHEKLTKEYSFRYGDKPYRLNAQFSRDAVRFSNITADELRSLFQCPVFPGCFKFAPAAARRDYERKIRTEAVNILLRFVQTAFQYKTDPNNSAVKNHFFLMRLFLSLF